MTRLLLATTLAIAVTSLALLPAAVSAQDCNICGDKNSIQFPTGVVEFEHEGQVWRNNCKTLQEIVKNPVAISDQFCRNELLAYTYDICRCTDPQGELVRTYYQAPTMSPAPGGPPAEKQSESNAEKATDSMATTSLTHHHARALFLSLGAAIVLGFLL